MKYCAIISGVESKYSDPNIDAIDFDTEEEARQWVIDETKDKLNVDLKPDQVEIFERASQRYP